MLRVVGGALVLLWLRAAAAEERIEVVHEPPSVTRVSYPRGRPPADMPAESADDAGACSNVFEIEALIGSAVEEIAPGVVRVYPERFRIVTRLRVTIYTPERAPQKLLAHEEGHRRIGEHYYASAEGAAREAALSVSGRSFEAAGADRAAAERVAADTILSAVRESFMARTHARSAAANARYDEFTAHGMRALAESAAVERAIAADP